MERNDRNTIIIGILIILLLVIGYYFLLFSPLRSEFVARSEERSQKEQQLQQLQQQVAELEEIARNAPEIERQLLEYSKRIPTQPEIPTFVLQVEEIAEAAGVTQISVEPGAPGPPPGGGDFSQIPVTMSFEGTYEELQDFMSRLLNLVRLVTVNGVSYETVEQENTTIEPGVERLLQVEISAEIYFTPQQVPSGPAPAAPAPGAAPAPAPAGGGTTGAQ